MSNRVEDLERQVAELQAAVNGLTEELVEMKERVRQLEDEQEVAVERETQPAAGPVHDETADTEPTEPTERTTHSDDHADVVEKTDAADGSASDGVDDAGATGDEVVVAEQDATTPDAEAAKEQQGDESEEDSDIIVA
ncbi:hypothetical protein JCM18237_30190 [Halorubrum luteum]